MKKALLLLLAVSLDGVASEVGASNPQLAAVVPNLVAIADSGASASWATQPSDKLASSKEVKEFENHVEGLDAKLNQNLDSMIAKRLEALIANEPSF